MTATTNSNAAFGGTCAFASVVKKGQPGLPAGNPNISATVDGQLYLFSNPVARILWRLFAAPSGKLGRWTVLVAIIGGLIWGATRLFA
jgi:hypothetical protein